MEKYIIRGGNRLTGDVEISGAKNAAVAILPAVVLADGVCRIENIPNIADVATTLDILASLGAEIHPVDRNTVDIDPRTIATHVVPHDLARHMRASYYFIGALLGRFGTARVSMPGGCNFGVRPIDQHLKGFTALGASVSPMEHGMIEVVAPKLTGSSIYLDVVSVGATVNIMLAAVKARGTTIIENAAKEPHIVDVANFLNSMGADIKGAGTDVIRIRGVQKLHGTEYTIIPDQIEAGTFMCAAVATQGDITVKHVIPKHLESISAKLLEMGAEIEELDDAVRVVASKRLQPTNIKTLPYPGFPTDMQPQMAIALALADGTSVITESIFENRFRYVDELARMGARIKVEGNTAIIIGVPKYKGAHMSAPDLRAGAALVIAALAADGYSTVDSIGYIQRGYEDFEGKLCSLGACIEKVDNDKDLQKFKFKVG